MAVILVNSSLTVRRLQHDFARDEHGMPVAPTVSSSTVGPFPGSVLEQQDGSWTVRLDPRCWEVEPGDQVIDDRGRVFVLSEARLFQVPGAPMADYIGGRAVLDPPDVP